MLRQRLLSTAGPTGLGLALLAVTSCSDIDAGHLTDDPGPPKLLRILVGDETPGLATGFITDLLDVRDPMTNPTPSCDLSNPCPAQINGVPPTPFGKIGSTAADCQIPAGKNPDCSDAMTGAAGAPLCGSCIDPLAAQPPEVGTPPGCAPTGEGGPACAADPNRIPGTNGGLRIGIVFNKILDPSIEQVAIDKQTNAYTYTIADGVIGLLDEQGTVVPTVNYYDPGGAPDNSSDPLGNSGIPLGPALVMKPLAPLDANARYTIQLDLSRVKDKAGQTPVNAAGKPLVAAPGTPYTFDFTTSDIAASTTALTLAAIGSASTSSVDTSRGPQVRLVSSSAGTPTMAQQAQEQAVAGGIAMVLNGVAKTAPWALGDFDAGNCTGFDAAMTPANAGDGTIDPCEAAAIPVLAPNDILQFMANADLDQDALRGLVVKGAIVPLMPAKGQPAAVDVEVWLDQGTSATQCATNTRLVDVAPVAGLGKAIDLAGCAAGETDPAKLASCTYVLTLAALAMGAMGPDTSLKAHGGKTSLSITQPFVVRNCDPTAMMLPTSCAPNSKTDSDPMLDALAVAALPMPEACIAPAGDGGAVPGDMAMMASPDMGAGN